MSKPNMEITIPLDATEVTLRTEGKYCESNIVVKSERAFRVETGVMVVEKDIMPDAGQSKFTIKIPCSNGAKTADFHADDATMAAIKATQGTNYLATFLGNFFAPKVGQAADNNKPRSYFSKMSFTESFAGSSKYNNGWLVDDNGTHNAANTDGVTFVAQALKAGTYEWTAYYWND